MANEVVEAQESVTTELWKDIKGLEGWYQISNIGRVKRLKKKHCNHGKTNIVVRDYILTPAIDRKGYLTVALPIDGKRKIVKVHRLVAEAFVPNPEHKAQIDHINRSVADNRVENLRWCTNKENQFNKNNNALLKCFGKEMPIGKWAEEVGISADTIRARLKRGWKLEDALTVRTLKTGEKLFLGRR